MDMQSYINEIEFAAKSIIEIIWKERDRLLELKQKIKSLSKVVRSEYEKAQSWAMNAEDPGEVAMSTGIYWNNYFGNDKDLSDKDKQKIELEGHVLAHQFSIAALSGALLQHAKQGVSLVHGTLSVCPSGRMIGSQHLKDVIWQGRNQAIHWEDGNFHKSVEDCFDVLSTEIDPKFNQYKSRSMASDLVELLDWKTFDKFKADLLQLA